jgi:hypothetical protein
MEREVDGDISLYDASQERVIVLNSTASDVWRLADGEMTVDQIAEALAKAYRTDPAEIKPDVEQLIDSLVQQKLLPTP